MRTGKDLTDYLTRFLGDSAQGSGLFQAKAAINAALREIENHFNFSYLYFAGRIATVAPYNTGTVTYIHTGSTYERQLTLSGGTWPSWAAAGVVMIANIAYDVDERRSSTVLTLTAASNPGADISSAATYTIYREKYPLPVDFKAVGNVTLANNVGELVFIHPSDWLRLIRNFATSSATPTQFTILGNPQSPGNMEVAFFPFPDQLRQIDMLYQRRPLQVVNWGYSEGTVSITAGTATLTGTGTAWTSRMAGAAVRLSADATNLPTALDDANPYQEELYVKEFTSATSLRLTGNAVGTYSGVKHIISDYVDLEEGTMMNAFLRCVEWQLAIIKQSDNMKDAMNLWLDALKLAKSGDSRSFGPKGSGNLPYVQRKARMPLGSDS